jgi:hypothetical protein
MMNLLNSYSKRFADLFFEEFPDWRTYAIAERVSDSVDEYYLVVKIPILAKGLLSGSLIPNEKDYLTIYCDEEITIAYDFHHVHFDSYSDVIESEEFRRAIGFLKDLINEKLCIIAVVGEKGFCGSSCIEANEVLDLSWWNWLNKEICKDIFIRSWKGTYNNRVHL